MHSIKKTWFGVDLMRIFTEEKKRSEAYFGTEIARAQLFYPRLEDCLRISDFYKDMAERLEEFFLKAARACLDEYEKMTRPERRDFAPFCMRLFFSVMHASEKEVSIVMEYAASRGKDLLLYRKMCFVWDTERELLLPPESFFGRRYRRFARKNEFFVDSKNAYIIENLFPRSAAQEGGRVHICDYTRETKSRRRNISFHLGKQS